jgi:transcriptional regulator with XRE-family HTH domain
MLIMKKPAHFGKISAVTDIGAAIRAGRLASGLRVSDICDLAGISLQTLNDLEAGKSGVGIGKMLNVAHILGIAFFSVSAEEKEQAEFELSKLTRKSTE